MNEEQRELTPEELELAQQAWFDCDRKTAIISAAFGLIINTKAASWNPWIESNDLGIPYSLGIEMGDIEEKGLTEKGKQVVELTYEDLCRRLNVESVATVDSLYKSMINFGEHSPEEKEVEN